MAVDRMLQQRRRRDTAHRTAILVWQAVMMGKPHLNFENDIVPAVGKRYRACRPGVTSENALEASRNGSMQGAETTRDPLTEREP